MTRWIVTIGNFDGVHQGHQGLLQQLVGRGRECGLPTFVVTFEPHPDRVIHPDRFLPTLTDTAERIGLMRAIGVKDIWVCPFTLEIARMEPAEFIELIEKRHRIAELWIGADFAMGRDRSGTRAVLEGIGAAEGWAIHVVPPYRDTQGEVLSSTRVRTALAAGDVHLAEQLLGRAYAVPVVLQGNQPGGAALVPYDRAVPAPGVYAARVITDGRSLSAVGAIPASPPLAHESRPIELRAVDGSLGDGAAMVEFVELLRGPASEREAAVGFGLTESDVQRARMALLSPR